MFSRDKKVVDKYSLLIAKSSASDCKSMINKGRALFLLKKYEEALNTFSKVHISCKKPKIIVDSIIGEGRALLKLGRFNEALSVFSDVKKKAPNQAQHAQRMAGEALAYIGLKRINDANKMIIWNDTKSPLMYIAKGYLLIELNQLERAIENFNKAIRITKGNINLLPDNLEAWEGKSIALSKLGRFQVADEASKMAQVSIIDLINY